MAVFGWNLDTYFEKRKMWFIDSFSMKKEKISEKSHGTSAQPTY